MTYKRIAAEEMEICAAAARAGGEVLLRSRGRKDCFRKPDGEIASAMDIESDRAIAAYIRAKERTLPIISEESNPAYQGIPENCWIVDPLDGTINFLHGLPFFSVSVALQREGHVVAGAVFDPTANECFTVCAGGGAFADEMRLSVSDAAELSNSVIGGSLGSHGAKGQEAIDFITVSKQSLATRRLGSLALTLSYVAAGRLDGCWSSVCKSWDVAAGALLVREAGGTVSGWGDERFSLDHPAFIAAASADLHGQLRHALVGCSSGR